MTSREPERQACDPNIPLESSISKTAILTRYSETIDYYCLLWCSTVGYCSDNNCFL